MPSLTPGQRKERLGGTALILVVLAFTLVYGHVGLSARAETAAPRARLLLLTAGHACAVAVLACLARLTTADPGLVSALGDRGPEPSVCKVCAELRPRGSHHCRTCDACVAGFDHHCVVLGLCIARNNVRTFVGLLLAAALPLLAMCQVTLACLAAELRLQPPSDPAAAAALALRFLPAATLFGLLGGFLGASSLAYGALNGLGHTFYSRPPLPLLRAQLRGAALSGLRRCCGRVCGKLEAATPTWADEGVRRWMERAHEVGDFDFAPARQCEHASAPGGARGMCVVPWLANNPLWAEHPAVRCGGLVLLTVVVSARGVLVLTAAGMGGCTHPAMLVSLAAAAVCVGCLWVLNFCPPARDAPRPTSGALPPLAAHCAACGCVVQGRDHHCGLLATCIGDDNRRAYVLLLLAAVVGGGVQCVVVGAYDMTHGVQVAVQAAIARSPPLPASAAELARPALLAALGHAWLAQLAGPLLSALANALLASFLVGGPLLFLLQQAVYASYAAGLVTHNQAPRLLNAMGLRDWGATAAQEESEVLLK